MSKAVDVKRPAFACNAKLRALVETGKCSTCQQTVDTSLFSTELERREYGISGMCSTCQKDCFGVPNQSQTEDCEKDIENLKSHVFGYDYTGPFEGDILSSVSSRDAPFSRPKMPPDFLSHRHDMTDSERLTAWEGDFTGNCFGVPKQSQTPPPSEVSISPRKGELTGKEKYFIGSQCYSSFSCSWHGEDYMWCIDDMDKHEIWQCELCKATKDFRVRRWILDGGPCSGYSEL